MRNSRHQLQTMSDNSSVVLLFPPGMSLLQFGSKVYPRKFLFQGFWRFRWVLLYGAGPAFLLHFRKMQMRKAKGGVGYCLIRCRTMETHLFFCKLLLYRNLHWVKSWFSLTKLNTYSNSKHSVWNCAANEKYFEKACFPLVTYANSYVAPVSLKYWALDIFLPSDIFMSAGFCRIFSFTIIFAIMIIIVINSSKSWAVGKFVMTFHSPE